MSFVPRHHVFSLDAYLEKEERSEDKHEYCDGQILAMAGGSPRHNYLAQRFQQLVANRLEGGPCGALSSDQRVATPDGLYTYADGSVFCEPMDVGPGQAATNPTVLVEVLSPSTRTYDRTEKLARYQTIPSLRHVVLIEQDGLDVEIWTRDDGAWTRTVAVEPTQTVRLGAIGVEVDVEQLYAGADRYPAW